MNDSEKLAEVIKQNDKELNRRVEVENYLNDVYQNKRPVPTPETCRLLALRLGTRKELWPDWLKEPLP